MDRAIVPRGSVAALTGRQHIAAATRLEKGARIVRPLRIKASGFPDGRANPASIEPVFDVGFISLEVVLCRSWQLINDELADIGDAVRVLLPFRLDGSCLPWTARRSRRH